MSIPRTWAGIDAAALHASVPLATFTHPSIPVPRPSPVRVALRFLGHWLVHSAVLGLAVLCIAAAVHWLALGRWLLDGLTADTVVRFSIAYAALCAHIGAVLTLALGRIGRGGPRHG